MVFKPQIQTEMPNKGDFLGIFEFCWLCLGLPEVCFVLLHVLRVLEGNVRCTFGDWPNMVSESTVSNIELSERFGPHRVPGRKVSEFLSAYDLRAKANSPSFSQDSPSS